MMTSGRAMLLLLGVYGGSALKVCMHTACKKAGSHDTLDTFRILAASSDEATACASQELAVATQQHAFGDMAVGACGCLGGCGSGPNCVSDDGEVYRARPPATSNPTRSGAVPLTSHIYAARGLADDVYKPASAVALLEAEGVHVPEAATRAWLKRMYAVRALRRNNPQEALSLLTLGLNEAGALREQGVALLSHLLDLRADVHESVRDLQSARADREHATTMRKLTGPTHTRPSEASPPNRASRVRR